MRTYVEHGVVLAPADDRRVHEVRVLEDGDCPGAAEAPLHRLGGFIVCL